MNAVGGQNSTWTAALFGGGLSLLERRPLLAGRLLGLLIYKPQLGLLIQVALLAGRHWRASKGVAVSLGERDVAYWHETVMPVLSQQVRYEGVNGPSSVAVRGPSLTQTGHSGSKSIAAIYRHFCR
jgi:hypothetical protein